MKKYIYIGLSTILVVLILLSWIFSSKIISPDYKCNEKHHIFCGGPEERGLKYSDVKIKTDDGLELKAWYLESEGSKKAILQLHGHGATLHEGLKYTPLFLKLGFNVLHLEFRGNSNIPGHNYYTMGALEKIDVKAAVDFLVDVKENKKIGIYGFSMGAVAGALHMAEDPRVGAGVFNSPFVNVSEQISSSAKRRFGIPYFPLVPMSIMFANIRTNSNMFEVDVEESLSKISPRPVFIIHSKGDHRVPIAFGKRNYEAAGNPKQKWFPDFDNHVHEWNFDAEKSEELTGNFFSRWLE